jgi:hypothetical protein
VQEARWWGQHEASWIEALGAARSQNRPVTDDDRSWGGRRVEIWGGKALIGGSSRQRLENRMGRVVSWVGFGFTDLAQDDLRKRISVNLDKGFPILQNRK